MMIQDISSLPTVITQWAEEIQSREIHQRFKLLLVIMMMVRRTVDIKSREIHQRFKHDAPGDYDVSDDGDEEVD